MRRFGITITVWETKFMPLDLSNAKEAVIYFTHEIQPETMDGLLDAVSECVNEGVQQLNLLISSPGGTVNEAISAYHILRGLPIRIITHNVGCVASSAITLFCCGDLRKSVPHGSFMFHAYNTVLPEGMMERSDLERVSRSIANDERQGHEILVANSNLQLAQVKAMHRQESAYLTPEEAMAIDFIHEISPVSIPAGTPLIGVAPTGAGFMH